MPEKILTFDIPPDVRMHMSEGKSFEEMVADLPNRSARDIEFGVLVLSRHSRFEELSKMMTICAIKYKNSKSILESIQGHIDTGIAEVEVDPKFLAFLKECNALALEFHVRAVAQYKATHHTPGSN